MSNPILRAALVAALASPAMAQWLPYGTEIMDGSQNLVTVNLGFNFTMPGGNVVTAVDVDETGRVIEVGIDPSDASESTTEMQANPGGSINVIWDTVGYTAAENSTVWFFTDNSSVAAVTWYEVNTPGNTTFQVQLHANGEIHMLYDSRNPEDDGIIGLSPGNGAVLPAQSDLSSAIGGLLTTTDPTIFEDFANTVGVNTVDWVSTMFVYSPIGAGGSGGWNVTAVTGIPDPTPVPFALAEIVGTSGCPVSLHTPQSFIFVPDGVGGYDVSSGPSAFDPNIGTLAGATADDTITAIGLDLGFAMPFPGGTSHQLVDIDPNGRILPTTAAGTTGDLSPSIADITADGYPYFFGLWSDWNVNESTSDGIYFNTVPGVSATFTWNNVAQFGTDPVPPCTWQIKLINDGSFIITHHDLSGYNSPQIGTSADDTAFGCTSGTLPDPGETDFSALTGTSINVPGYVYEWFDSSGTAPVEPVDLITPLPTYIGNLASLSFPIIGTTWSLEMQNAAAAAFGFYLVGTTPASLDLTFLGSPCNLLVNSELTVVTFPNGTGGMLPFDLAVPNSLALSGAEIYVQGALTDAPTPPFSGFAGLPWTISFTNSIRGTIGEF